MRSNIPLPHPRRPHPPPHLPPATTSTHIPRRHRSPHQSPSPLPYSALLETLQNRSKRSHFSDKNTRHSYTPLLFTRASRFPSRTLPLPGVRACNLDAGDTQVFRARQKVRVRRFTLGKDDDAPGWSDWEEGQVVGYVPFRSDAGSYGHAYRVRTQAPSLGGLTSKKKVETYVQFLGEICKSIGPTPSTLTAEECVRRRKRADCIYTRIPSEGIVLGIPHSRIWTPAQILTYGTTNILVLSLAGPTAGMEFWVDEHLPYTMETTMTVRKCGEEVLGPMGRLLFEDIAIAPLEFEEEDDRMTGTEEEDRCWRTALKSTLPAELAPFILSSSVIRDPALVEGCVDMAAANVLLS
ncbi:hypothetical protein R3P38DRAFT_3176818 [Favolaschia claudopus]|uniref:Uncharacterized protein n=1 Tax=Favolaschia claudopus TaxID=2862362 RepID=A0AAW0D1A5_9AGAR